MKTKYWETKDGEKIEYNELKDSHLLHILKWIETRAKCGVTIIMGGCGSEADTMWGDEEIMTGDRVLELYDYQGLTEEAEARGLVTKEESRYDRKLHDSLDHNQL